MEGRTDVMVEIDVLHIDVSWSENKWLETKKELSLWFKFKPDVAYAVVLARVPSWSEFQISAFNVKHIVVVYIKILHSQ